MEEAILTNSTSGIQPAAPKQPQLERFATELAHQAELLNLLESKLDTVSTRLPEKDDVGGQGERVHISTLISIMNRNNNHIERLINEIDL